MVWLAVSSSKEGVMALLDKVKSLVGGHKDQSKEGVSKAGQLADEKSGGSHSSQIDSAENKADQEIDGMDGGGSTP
jgi:MT0933-like antitoxin protein